MPPTPVSSAQYRDAVIRLHSPIRDFVPRFGQCQQRKFAVLDLGFLKTEHIGRLLGKPTQHDRRRFRSELTLKVAIFMQARWMVRPTHPSKRSVGNKASDRFNKSDRQKGKFQPSEREVSRGPGDQPSHLRQLWCRCRSGNRTRYGSRSGRISHCGFPMCLHFLHHFMAFGLHLLSILRYRAFHPSFFDFISLFIASFSFSSHFS